MPELPVLEQRVYTPRLESSLRILRILDEANKYWPSCHVLVVFVGTDDTVCSKSVNWGAPNIFDVLVTLLYTGMVPGEAPHHVYRLGIGCPLRQFQFRGFGKSEAQILRQEALNRRTAEILAPFKMALQLGPLEVRARHLPHGVPGKKVLVVLAGHKADLEEHQHWCGVSSGNCVVCDCPSTDLIKFPIKGFSLYMISSLSYRFQQSHASAKLSGPHLLIRLISI